MLCTERFPLSVKIKELAKSGSDPERADDRKFRFTACNFDTDELRIGVTFFSIINF